MWRRSRAVSERIVIEGTLVLDTPASLSNGDSDAVTDIPLLTDPLEGRALLTGTSLAGALRNYLRERSLGYGQAEISGHIIMRLFGSLEDDGEQSALIVDDALGGPGKPGVELHDGVRIDGQTRTAYVDEKGKGAKFDLELLEAGTEFDLRLELLICQYDNAPSRDELLAALTIALSGLESGGIHLGARKRRGYGQVRVKEWRAKHFDLCQAAGLFGWIDYGADKLLDYDRERRTKRGVKQASKVTDVLDVTVPPDARALFRLKAEFSLAGSLLIRSGGKGEAGPDMIHLHSKHRDSERNPQTAELLPAPVLSGTSPAGALRARAGKIANTLAHDDGTKAANLIACMFGTMQDRSAARASRVVINEHVLKGVRADLVQSRVSLDRFTGGAREGALFNQQPALGLSETTVTVEIALIAPQPHEIGLLLLLLKDLWTSDLPLGGESSVGRGRLRGKEAVIVHAQPASAGMWTMRANGPESDELKFGGDDTATLENYVSALSQYMREITG